MFTAASYPARRTDPSDPRWLDLRVTDASQADLVVCGIPFDAAVIGRRGAAGGPAGIREAFRYLACHDPDSATDLSSLRWCDLGDADGLTDNVLESHRNLAAPLDDAFRHGAPVVVLGGDNSLSYPVVKALAKRTPGQLGVVVLDAHYDLRSYQGQPSSGTPYRRILEELDGRVAAANLAEVGIRPFANNPSLAKVAAEKGIRVHTMGMVRSRGIEAVAQDALRAAAQGTTGIWLSVDIDGLDQSIASGCSAPGAGGLTFAEAAHLVRLVAAHPSCKGMDLVEVAPSLDPTGNTCRTAAQLVAEFAAGVASRPE